MGQHGFRKCLISNFEDLNKKNIRILPHTLNKRIIVYNIDKL
jgi:hypothetical protein